PPVPTPAAGHAWWGPLRDRERWLSWQASSHPVDADRRLAAMNPANGSIPVRWRLGTGIFRGDSRKLSSPTATVPVPACENVHRNRFRRRDPHLVLTFEFHVPQRFFLKTSNAVNYIVVNAANALGTDHTVTYADTLATQTYGPVTW